MLGQTNEMDDFENMIFLLQVALRRQQAQEESEARELGLQLQYNTANCTTASVLPSATGASPPVGTGSPPHPAHVSSPVGLSLPNAAAAAAAAAAQIQNQLQHQQSDCGNILQRMRVPGQDDYRSVKAEKNETNSHANSIAAAITAGICNFFINRNCTMIMI